MQNRYISSEMYLLIDTYLHGTIASGNVIAFPLFVH